MIEPPRPGAPNRSVLAALLTLTALLIPISGRAAEETGQFLDLVYRDDQGDHKYAIFLPAGYTPEKEYPMVVYLHGASCRGRDGRAQLMAGLGPAVKLREKTFPMIAVFPQCETFHGRLLGGWSEYPDDAERALRIIAEVERNYRVNPRHRILTGVSMGGFGTWKIAARNPEMWAAIIPVSGGGDPELPEKLKGIPTWAFHADDDNIVPTTESLRLTDGITALGGRAWTTILPEGGHNIGAPVYARDELYEWMLDPSRTPALNIAWRKEDFIRPTVFDDAMKFVPGAEVRDAVTLHVGRDLLESLAYVLPNRIPADAVQGWKPATRETTWQFGLPFDITVGGIRYSGTIEQARLTPMPDNTLVVQIGLRNLWMRIQQTRIDAGLLNVTAGAMNVVVGHRAPVWLNVRIHPRIEQRRIKMQVVGAGCRIPDNNWYVSNPRNVQVTPLPFLNNRMADRIADGVREKKTDIERQLLAGIPEMVRKLEEQANAQTDRVVSFGRWPMPLWQPRFKFWPQDLAFHADGLTVTLGATVAALAPKSETLPIERIEPLQGPAPELSGPGVQVAVSRQLMETWSRMLARSDVARLHSQDLSAQAFRDLGRRDVLERILPDLRRFPPATEVNVELVVAEPFQFPPPPGSDTDVIQTMTMSLPKLVLEVGIRHAPAERWQPYAEFPCAVNQDFTLAFTHEEYSQQSATFSRRGPADIVAAGRFAPEYQPVDPSIDSESLRQQFLLGWEQSFRPGGRTIELPDREFSGIPLRIEKLGFHRERILVQLYRPPAHLANDTDRPVTLQTRLPHGRWSNPFMLQPGDRRDVDSPVPLICRDVLRPHEELTLPLGQTTRIMGPDGTPPITHTSAGPSSR